VRRLAVLIAFLLIAPTRVVLRRSRGTAVRCELGLETADTFVSASPSLSPDGSRVS